MLTRANWRQPLLFIIICALFTGLIFSRAVLSIASVAFVLLLISNPPVKSRITTIVSTPIFILISALFFIPFISVFWSNDKEAWLQMITTKLPFLLFPIAFAQGFQLSQKQWKKLAWVFLLLVLAATIYSTTLYLSNAALYEATYKQAKVLPTPMHGDHLRFSLLVSIALLLSLFLFQKIDNRLHKKLLIILALWLLVYLHLLAARTGLLCSYIIILSIAINYAFSKRKSLLAIGLILSIVLLPLIAWISLPTFKARILYLRYDLTQVYHGHYIGGTTDGSRVLSLKGGWELLKGSPFGVGLGDIKAEMNAWYAEAVPNMIQSDKLFPSSEWLVHGLIAGWPGLILFSMIIVAPFFMQLRYRFWWCLLNAVLACSILFDTGLSTQFGIFIHAFFILLWWQFSKYNNDQKISTLDN